MQMLYSDDKTAKRAILV